MEFYYEQSYHSFFNTYGYLVNWPIPYNYTNWYYTLTSYQQAYYINPTNYSMLYSWANEYELQIKRSQKPAKLNRNQKRKLKKKLLSEEYESQKNLIGKWVDKQRKDLVDQLTKIEEQEKKIKLKKQNRLSYLIEIHKEVYKHHMKKKNNEKNTHNYITINRRVKTKNKNKKLTIIKKMKEIFEIRNNKQKFVKENKQQKQYEQKLLENVKDEKKIHKNQAQIVKEKNYKDLKMEDDHYQDISDDQNEIQTETQNETFFTKKQKFQNQIKEKANIHKSPHVSFNIQSIHYKNIGKLSGKIYCQILLRQWVTNVPIPQLQQPTLRLINRLAYKQAIKRIHKPEKARKLIVSGIKECKRTLTTILDNKKSKCLIVALNIERNNLIKGTDDQVQKCIQLGQQNRTPIVHVSTRSKLGRAFTGKFGPRLTIISIINYEGYQDMFDNLMEVWHKSCKEYDNIKQI